MSRKVWLTLLLAGLAVYVAYIITILRPYFARVDANIIWQMQPTVDVSQIHIGDQGMIYASGSSGMLMISPDGNELYHKQDNPIGYSYGYDENGEDTLFICEVIWVNQGKLQQQQQQQQLGYGQYSMPVPGQAPEQPEGEASANPYADQVEDPDALFVAEFKVVDSSGQEVLNKLISLDGYVSNLWCNADKVYFMDNVSNIHCFSEGGEELWTRNYPGLIDFNKGSGGRLFINIGSDIVATGEDGIEIWRTSLGPGAQVDNWRNWAEAGGSLCVLHDYGTVSLIAPDGQVSWSSRLWSSGSYFGSYDYSEPAIVLQQDGTVYALDSDAVVWSIGQGGATNWRFKVGGSPNGLAASDSGVVYLQSQQRGLMALTPQGKLKWRDPRLGNGSARPKTGPGNRLYLMNGYKLVAVDISGD